MSADLNDRTLQALGWLFHLGGLVTLVFGGCAYEVVVSGFITHRQSADAAEIARLEAVLETKHDTGRDLARLQAELKRLEASAEAARLRIPETAEEAEFLAQISEAAAENGLQIEKFTTGTETVLPTHSQLQIHLLAKGDYAGICGFFERMAKFTRAATVSNMHLTVPANSEIFPLDMTLTLYFGARVVSGGSSG